MTAHINTEGFEYIEARRSVTAEEFAAKFGITIQSARTWLSRWTKRGYLRYIPSSQNAIVGTGRDKRDAGRPTGKYGIGEKEWSNLYYENNDESAFNE